MYLNSLNEVFLSELSMFPQEQSTLYSLNEVLPSEFSVLSQDHLTNTPSLGFRSPYQNRLLL